MKLQELVLSCFEVFALASCQSSNSISTKQSGKENNEITHTTPSIKLTYLSDFCLSKTNQIADSKTYVSVVESVNLTYDVGYKLLLSINEKFKPTLDKITNAVNQYAPGPTNYYHVDFTFKANGSECKINIPEKDGDVFIYQEKKNNETIADVFTSDFTFDDKCQSICENMKSLFEGATTK